MKSKELIRLIQEEDPTGEVEVCIGNADIFSVHTQAAYWDGKLQILKRDPAKAPYYDIVGARYTTKGSKMVITAMSIVDVLSDNPDAEIDYSELGDTTAAHYKEQDDKTRALARHIERRCELNMFQRWAKGKAEVILPGYDEEQLMTEAEHFYDANLKPDDPLPNLPPKQHKDGYSWYPSVSERRVYQWDESITIGWSGLDFEFSKK
jgi:hypothetical protein